MRRRDFLAFAAGAAAMSPAGSFAQRTATIPRVGVLWHAGSAEEEDVYLSVVKKAFSDLGYVEGKTIILEHRFPAEQAERFRSMAQELADSKLDVIISVTELGARELRRATQAIPIVVVLAQDPVAAGLVDSLAHPGGNVTGLSLMGVDLSGKRVALLKEAVPGVSRVTLMIDPKDPASKRVVSSSLAAAKELGLELRIVEVSSPAAIDTALAELAAAGSEALISGGGPLTFNDKGSHRCVRVGEKAPDRGRRRRDGAVRSVAKLWSRFSGLLSARRRLCRQDSQRRKAGGPSGRATLPLQAHHQSQGREIDRPVDAALAADKRRRSARMRHGAIGRSALASDRRLRRVSRSGRQCPWPPG
jgi:putative tryptophan/tyrosine transport system substrate-binding protein